MRLIIISILLILIILPSTSLAGLLNTNPGQDGFNPLGETNSFATDAGYNAGPGTDVNSIVGNAIQVVLGFVGTLFLILIIWSGLQWMTAGGNTETITKAKQRMVNATIGLVIVLAAYSITWFITEQALSATGGLGEIAE